MTSDTTIAVNDREELVYLLTEAAEFEHTVMCTYLYAQWSLKQDESEGITGREKQAIERWRGLLRSVALEEMLHLALVNNILAAIGSTPHLWRPGFPVARGYFPSDVDFHLAPFGQGAIDHFVYIERPEGIDLEDGLGFVHESRYPRVACTDLLTPTPRDYQSQGHLYHGIGQALLRLTDQVGEEGLFVGHGESQLGSAEYPLPGLFEVTGLESALKALEEIVAQGEGAPAHREDSHFARFASIRDEYEALRKARPDFEPARPAAVNPVLAEYRQSDGLTRIENPDSRRVVDLGNSVYALMVHVLAQVCSPTPLPSGLRQGLSDVSSELMRLMTAIGQAATHLPAGQDASKGAAGLSFALPRSFGLLTQSSAAQILAERTAELAAAARKLDALPDRTGVADGLAALADSLREMHEGYESHFGEMTFAAPPSPGELAAQAERDDVPAQSDLAADSASSDEITIFFNTDRCIHSRRCVLNAPTVFLANVEGPWLHPETDSAEHLAHVAQSCPSGAITYRRLDGGPEEPAPAVNTVHLRENGPYAVHAAIELEGEKATYRATLCRCGKSRNKPFCDNTHREAGFEATGEPETVASEPLEERGGPLKIMPVRNGPLKVRGPLEICAGTGRTVTRTQYVKLCRCGGSANKPFCDDTHLRIGFKSD